MVICVDGQANIHIAFQRHSCVEGTVHCFRQTLCSAVPLHSNCFVPRIFIVNSTCNGMQFTIVLHCISVPILRVDCKMICN